jgi:hypothetical protein
MWSFHPDAKMLGGSIGFRLAREGANGIELRYPPGTRLSSMRVNAGLHVEGAGDRVILCRRTAEAHEITYSFWVLIERASAIVAAVAASIVAIKLFSEADEGSAAWEWAAWLSATAAACSAVSLYLGGLKLSEKHQTAGKSFRILERRFEDLQTELARDPDYAKRDDDWAALNDRLDELEGEDGRPTVGQTAQWIARRRLASNAGEADPR